MADRYIDPYEAIAYGNFTKTQVPVLVRGLVPKLDAALDFVAQPLYEATDHVAKLLHVKSSIEPVTYASAAGGAGGQGDPVAASRDAFERLVAYAKSRAGGDAIVRSLLQGKNLSTLLRQRGPKLAGTLGHAIGVVAEHKDALPEHAEWTKELRAAQKALDTLNTNVRASRAERRAMTPEVAAARQDWLTKYGTLKLQVQVILRLAGRPDLLVEVFDDLAEIHRVPGVRDDLDADPDDPTPAPAGTTTEGG